MMSLLRSLCVILTIPHFAAAASIGVNFGSGRTDASLPADGSAGVIPQTNWNNAPGNRGSLSNLKNDNGSPSTADITWNADEQWSIGQTPADANGTLMNGWISANNNGSPSTIVISAIPFASYDLYFYLNHDRGTEDVLITESSAAIPDFLAQENDPSINTPITFARQTESATTNPGATGNYVLFENLTSATLNLVLTPAGSAGSADRGAITGIQIVERTVIAGLPEVTNGTPTAITPTSATLGGELLDNGAGNDIATLTFYWGATDGGTDPFAWDFTTSGGSRTSPGPFVGTISGLAPGETYHYRVFASNSAGDDWAPASSSLTTFAAPPALSQDPASEILATSATVRAEITDTGGDTPQLSLFYGTSDGGTSAASWEARLDLGLQSGSVEAQLAGLSPDTTYFFRAAATNSGGTSWAAATAAFRTQTLTLPALLLAPASSINGTSATLHGEITATGGEPPVVTFFYGTTDGREVAANWDSSLNLGAQSGTFSRLVNNLSPNTTYFFKARATNSAGQTWSTSSLSFTTPEFVAPSVVINEIHFDEADKTERAEFIELHNPSDQAVDLSGCAFTSGIDFLFPNGTILEAGGFLVVAEDPATATAKFGIANPLGPFANQTNLRNSGETLTLSGPSGELIDEVTYSLGFPWPTVGDELGNPAASPSIELINPLLDNDLGGSWRASGFPASETTGDGSPVTLVAPGQTDWQYRNGESYPAADASGKSWWDPGYDGTNDGEWLTGAAPLGFGDNDDATVLTGMQGNYTSLFTRKEFNIAPGSIPSAVTLRCYHDDGAVIYLNGFEVGRFSLDPGPIPFPPPNGFANNHEAAWTEITVTGAAAFLVEGPNVIAVQGINTSINSSDFSLDAALETLPAGSIENYQPTPGAPNSSYAPSAPPQIRQVSHTPEQPASGQEVVVTAKITSPNSVAEVSLQYQIVEPGDYFCRFLKFNPNGTPNPDPRYEDPANWISLAMNDAGHDGDLLAGDAIYSVTLPTPLQQNRRLIRYRLRASDAPGMTITVPYPDDPQPNFAYFVYDGTPDWTGRIRPGDSPVTYPGSLMSSIPTYFLLTTSAWVNDSQFGGYGGSEYLWPGTMVYDGRVYDHIQYRPRGGVHRFQYGKNFWKFDFHRGHRFRARDRYGKRYETEWDKLNFSSIVQQVGFGHRGEQGLFEATGFRLFQLAGVEACHTHHTQFYVVDDASPNGATQYDTDYYGLYLAIEQMDGQFLDEHGLPDGNLYKIEGHLGDSNNQGPTQVSDRSDVSTFINSYRNGNPTAQWWRDHLDLEKYFSYRTIVEGIHHYDIAYGKNYFYYHNPETAKFEVHPWDLDLTWANNMYGNGNHDFKIKVAQNPAFNIDYQNRVREVMDLVYNNDEGDRVIDELVKDVWTAGQPSLVGADRRLWDNHPRITSPDRYYDISSTRDFDGMIQLTKNYLASRGNWMTSNLLTDRANIPETPVITRSGDSLDFTSTGYRSPAGIAFSAMEWRLSEISHPDVPGFDPTKPYQFEIEDPYESGELTAFNPNYRFPLVSARPGHTYRARVRHRDAQGRWSHWSDPAEFIAPTPDVSVYQNALVISEVMFNPPAPSGDELTISTENDDFEFIEIQNVSTQVIDLTGVRFTKGIDFDFPAGTQLAPGSFILVVKNQAAFEARYGSGLPVAGNYGADNLSNGGEQIKLSLGAGTAILDFIYDDAAPWPSGIDGNGASLTLTSPLSLPDHALAVNWRASSQLGGSPGADDTSPYFTWAADFGLIGFPDDDEDGDGISNLMEFALAGDPKTADLSILPVAERQEGRLALRFQRPALTAGLTYRVEFSSDLEHWSSDRAQLLSADPGAGDTVVELWAFEPEIPNQSMLFARLRVFLE